jgi:Na+/phosphate symporter
MGIYVCISRNEKLKTMGLILFGIIGCFIGCLVLVGILNHQIKSRHSEDIQELIKQSEERLEKSKKYGEELDRMLEEMKK